jgi:Protein ENHANCED DISEASE RESISTANCE 2, C-terminal
MQGHSEDELPERLLGSVRLNHLDLRAARELDTSVEIQAEQRPVPNGFFEDSKRSLTVIVPASAPASATATPTPSNQGAIQVY